MKPLSKSPPQDTSQRLLPPEEQAVLSPDLVYKLVWAFVLLGLVARCFRYFLRFPLWEDEAFLSFNLMDRDFSQLGQPLVFGQVAPVLFLAAQVAAIKVAGFHELSLRLVSFLSGVASLLVFRHLAMRLFTGLPLLFGVAIFSVAYPCVRYSAEAKPYGSDLLISLTLLAMAVHYWQSRRSGWLWGVAALAPFAVGFSYPAIFVGGGVSLAIGWLMWREQRRDWLAWVVLNGLLLASFTAVFWLSTRQQVDTQLDFMQHYWEEAFPPLARPWQLPGWLLLAHSSDMVAYPFGGEGGRSAATSVMLAVGLWLLIRARRWNLLWLLLAPLGLTLAAAALRLYPYGGGVRLNIYMAPAICLLAGLGLAELNRCIWRQPLRMQRAALAALTVLAGVGVGCMGRDVTYPYKALADERVRAFARWFWFNASQDGEVACTIADLGQPFAPDVFSRLNWTAEYLCNQRIYSPRHARRMPVAWDKISQQHPLRCVVYRCESTSFDSVARNRWLDSMQDRYKLVGRETFPLVRMDKGERVIKAFDCLEIYKFIPLDDTSSTAVLPKPAVPR